ncbi:MAG: DUF4328 domain-containing protein, partial [Myxococcales bacterium]
PVAPPPARLRSRAVWPALLALQTAAAATGASRAVLAAVLIGHEAGGATQPVRSSLAAHHTAAFVPSTLLHLTGWVLMLVWLHRIWGDVARLHPDETPAYTPGWAVGGFFVPIVNVVHPWSMFSALRLATDPARMPLPQVDDPHAGYRDAPSRLMQTRARGQVTVGVWYLTSVVTTLLVVPARLVGKASFAVDALECALGAVGAVVTVLLTLGLQERIDEQRRRAEAHVSGTLPVDPERPSRVALVAALPPMVATFWLLRSGLPTGALLPTAAVALGLTALGVLGLHALGRRSVAVPRLARPALAAAAVLLGSAAAVRLSLGPLAADGERAGRLFEALRQDLQQVNDADEELPVVDARLARAAAAQADLGRLASERGGSVFEAYRCFGGFMLGRAQAVRDQQRALAEVEAAGEGDLRQVAALEQALQARTALRDASLALASYDARHASLLSCLRDGHVIEAEVEAARALPRPDLELAYHAAAADLRERQLRFWQRLVDEVRASRPFPEPEREALVHEMTLAQHRAAVALRAARPPEPTPAVPSLADDRRSFTTAVWLEADRSPAPPPGLVRTTFAGPLGRMTAYASPPPTDRTQRPAVLWALDPFDPESSLAQAAELTRRGVVVMVPLVRGWRPSPGRHELMLGEVDDLSAARQHLAARVDVDSSRIVAVGEGVAGADVMLLATTETPLRAVVALRPVLDPAEAFHA